eukprot:91770-Alexandrium_andersonii.AAC.1
MVREGRAKEMQRLKEFEVFKTIDASEKEPGAPTYTLTWVDRLKTDEVRSRVCVRELKQWGKNKQG